jgi:small subunit ribosomal protein S2
VIAMVDTNCDPDPVDFPIPSNDDAIRAIKLMVSTMSSAVLEGQALYSSLQAEEEAAPEGEETADRYLGPSTLAHIAADQEDEGVAEDEEGEEELVNEDEALVEDETPVEDEALVEDENN